MQGSFFEVETNATRSPSPAFAEAVNQLNVSPKLANSGMPEAQRAASLLAERDNNEAVVKGRGLAGGHAGGGCAMGRLVGVARASPGERQDHEGTSASR